MLEGALHGPRAMRAAQCAKPYGLLVLVQSVRLKGRILDHRSRSSRDFIPRLRSFFRRMPLRPATCGACTPRRRPCPAARKPSRFSCETHRIRRHPSAARPARHGPCSLASLPDARMPPQVPRPRHVGITLRVRRHPPPAHDPSPFVEAAAGPVRAARRQPPAASTTDHSPG
jgi:hypothetical protein